MNINHGAKVTIRSASPNRVLSSVAKLILSVVAGVPMRSAEHLLPSGDEQASPYLGV